MGMADKNVFVVLEKSGNRYEIRAHHMRYDQGAVLFYEGENTQEGLISVVSLAEIHGVATQATVEHIRLQR